MLEVRIDDPMIVFIRQWQHYPIPIIAPHSTNDFPSSHGTKFAHLLIHTTSKKYKISTKMDNRKSSPHEYTKCIKPQLSNECIGTDL